MRDENCAACRSEIADILGRREGLSAACAAHLRTCPGCEAYAELVAALAAGPVAGPGEAPGPDWLAADEALGAASRTMARRRELLHFSIFLGLAAAAMAAWTWAGISGKGESLLALQAMAFLALPFTCLAALTGRMKGGTA
jgi:hypothetical protein